MMQISITFLSFAIFTSLCAGAGGPSGFTCQGGSYAAAMNNCPDKGTQKMTSGGNVTVVLYTANNLPKPSSPIGVSYPYVKFSFGDQVRESSVQIDTLNPNWNGERINLGLLGSATNIHVEVWNQNIGLSFSSVPQLVSAVRVPFCSTFNANYSTVDCGRPFGCESDDSLWKMPKRQLCTENGYIAFNEYRCTSANGLCLYFKIEIVPFTMTVDLTYPKANLRTPQLTVAAKPQVTAPWTYSGNIFGFPFLSDTVTQLDMRIPDSAQLNGALMLKAGSDDKAFGAADAIKFYASVNYPAHIYVCRNALDNANGIPEWLKRDFVTKNASVQRLLLQNTEIYFGCFYYESTGTIKNKYGGIKSGAIPFRTNTIAGYDTASKLDQTFYSNMYIVLAVFRTIVPRDEIIIMFYDGALFLNSFGSYGFVWAWFMYFVARFLHKIDYRIDRITTYLSKTVLTGENKCLVAALFMTYGQTPCNVDYRAHLFHTRNIMLSIIILPNVLLVSWGFSIAPKIRPNALGFAIAFLGSAAVFSWFGFRLWETNGWRLAPTALVAQGAAVILFFCFIISVIFVDPGVVLYGHTLNFSAISLLFGTMNVIPLMLLVFKNDKTFTASMKTLLEKLQAALHHAKQPNKQWITPKKEIPVNKLLHALLGPTYTINPNVPLFKFAAVLLDGKKKPDPILVEGEGEVEDDGANVVELDDAYKVSLFLLFVYLMIGVTRTSYPSLAFLNCLTLFLFDTIHTSIDHGDINWSPGYKITLLVAGRLIVMGSSGSYWMLYYSFAYLVYSTALIQEIINRSLPMLSSRQAGQMVFAGTEESKEKNLDIAGSASFCFGLVTFAFVGIILVAAFGGTRSVLPVPKVLIWGAHWPVYIFGLIAVCVTITLGLFVAMIRAFYLQHHGLLRGWARENYMLHKSVNVPIILAIFTEVAILTSGILIYGATRAPVIIISAVFIPPIALCLGYAYNTWTKNDFELVVWPPVDPKKKNRDDSPSDLEVAFNMIEGIFGDENTDVLEDVPETEGPQERTLKGFKLPSLETTGSKIEGQIKMPPLPLKSVLRKKRAALGIKTKQPLVKDLKLREGAEADKFGSSDDVLDANDPWAQFEERDDESTSTVKSKKKGTAFKMERRAWYDHPFIVNSYNQITKSKAVMFLLKKFRECLGKMKATRDKYAKVDIMATLTGEDEDDANDDTSSTSSKRKRLQYVEDEKKEGEEGGEEDVLVPMSEKLAKMPFWTAVVAGFLTRAEYLALGSWFGGLFLIFIMGVTLAGSVRPSWMGHIFWVATCMFILTFVPVIKYFNTYTVDPTMKHMIYFVAVFHFVFCLAFWATALNADPKLTESLWILDYFFYFPAFLYLVVELYRWRDSDFAVSVLDKDGDKDISIGEYLEFFKAYPILVGMMIILNWQMYVWISYFVGEVLTLFLLVGGFGYIFVRDWAVNDFFLSPEMATLAGYMINLTLFITFMVSIFSASNPIFPLSIFFFTYIFRGASQIVTRIMVAEPDTKIFFSPFVLPVYTYNPRTNDVMEETETVKQVLNVMIAGAMWGACTATFLYPVNVGIAVCCIFILGIAAIVATTVSFVPMELGRYATMLTSDIILGAASAAVATFEDRKQPLDFEYKSFAGRDLEPPATSLTPLGKFKQKTSLQLAADTINETRALTYVQDDGNYTASQQLTLIDVDEVIPYWYEKLWTDFKAVVKQLFEMIPIGQMKGWAKHSEAILSPTDAMAEALITGRGPFGFLGVDGRIYKLLMQAKENPNLKFLRQPWLNIYDEFGNSRSVITLSEPLDSPSILGLLTDMDKAMQHTYYEESRCAIHFLVLLMVSADANLQRETVLFQKFLRENRFRLASNGISPPAEIFSSSSYSSIDIPLVAVWLSTLSAEERDRFHQLKTTFSEEQKVRDDAIDDDDYNMQNEAMDLGAERAFREKEMISKLNNEIAFIQEQRVQAFADTLMGDEKKKFAQKRDIWTTTPDCYVEARDEALYDKFKAACFQDIDESTEWARAVLGDIEAAQKDCKIGEYGRVYQFVDSEFPPGDGSIGDCAARDKVLGWRCAPGISDVAQLFEGGTDPDDVEQGVFKDSWLLSAVSMLAAAGGVGDGGVDEQIMNLFVGHVAMDGEITFHTEIGGYCVRLFKQGQWVPIIVDDLFPMLRGSEWTNENRGMACAHSKECRELWVSLIEKAYAKYYGSYAILERGFTHHALSDLTGCDAECIPLAMAGRGLGKRALWDQLVRFKSNGYILGAGTGSSALADKGIADMGIVFNVAYTIYDIRSVDGHHLLKLRNPPGDHDEWKGDWSDDSELWTRRLKGKLGWVDADDNTFYISFDDFCNVFRYLYVCKWYNPSRWTQTQYPCFWKKPNEMDMEQRELLKDMMKAEGIVVDTDAVAEKRKKARSQIDTAGGMPTKHNPGCVLENNPHFALFIYRSTEIRITVSQADSRGKANSELLPVSIIIVKNTHKSEPQRLKSLSKDNVIAFTEPKKDRTIFLHASLKPGLYIVLIPAYLSGMQGNFSVNLVSNYRSKFSPLWPPKWMIKGEMKGNQADQLLEGGAGAAKESIDRVGKMLRKSMQVLFGAGVADDDDDEEEASQAASKGGEQA